MGFFSGLAKALTSDGAKVGFATAGGGAAGGALGYTAQAHFGDADNKGYEIAGHHVSQQQAWAAGGALFGAVAAGGGMAFFNHMKAGDARDYVVVVDKSAKMAGNNWTQAGMCVMQAAPEICKCDANGVTLILFDDHVQKHEGLKNETEVAHIFDGVQPGGACNLALGLEAAFADGGKTKGKTVLVITAGEPDNKNTVADILRAAADKLADKSELSVSFIQIGDDAAATQFLKWLDDSLKAKFDIVDTMKDEDLAKMGVGSAMKHD
jgi:hypothetical protein